MRLRQLAPVAVILVLNVMGFLGARLLTQRDARNDAKQRAAVAAAQVSARIAQAASLTESLRRSMLDAGGTGLTSDQFARIAFRWLTPADFAAAAWVERIPDSERQAYERRIGGPIVTPGDRQVVPSGSRSSYLPATLVSGFSPMDVSGIDLSAEPGMATALTSATRRNSAAATPVTDSTAGTSGLFLVAPASNLVDERLRPGYVVVFVSDRSLREAAPAAPNLHLTGDGGATKSFTEAAQRFEVSVPRESPHGGEAALPWIILGGGLALAGLAAALGINAARRAKAQDELDRIFKLSPDLITVADFEGHFTRVNPAVENVLGYTPEEFLAKPYLDLVHPDDRDRTQAEAGAIAQGKRTLSFSNRYRHRDGSYRTLEWTSTPVVEDGLMYGVARDVTERRAAEAELTRLAEEQVALRRVATAVARGSTPDQVFATVAEEVARLLGADSGTVDCYLADAECMVVGSWGQLSEAFPIGSRWQLDEVSCSSLVYRTKRPARVDSYELTPGSVALEARKVGVRSAVGSPITVDGRLWGALVAGTSSPEPLPRDAEGRIAQFTELVGTAISNIETRAEVERLADGQAALRRVAELVAREAPQAEVFRAIAVEVGQLFGTEEIRMWRYEPDRESALVVGSAGSEEAFPLGVRHDLSGDSAAARVLRSGRPARLDSYNRANGPVADVARSIGVRSSLGVPILVEGRLWGAIVTGSTKAEPLPPGTESRLEEFTELMATAIANTEARTEVERLAREQAALRRVATLVAQGATPGTVLDAV